MIATHLPGKSPMVYILFLMLLFGCTNEKVGSDDLKKPNIVFVLVDDLRWDEFGAAGHNYIKTPNIDRLAVEGARFLNAFATTPLCSPSRASFLTGRYAHSHGIVDNTERSEQSYRLHTFPAQLDTMGYETAFIGKWHMGNDNGERPGFDYWAALKGQGKAIDPEFNINGQEIEKVGYVTDILTDLSLDFMKEAKDKPFVLYLSHKGLHPNLHQAADGSVSKVDGGGFIAAERHKGMYKDDVFERRPNAYVTPTDKPALMRKIDGLPVLGKETATPEQVIRDRAEMLMAIDESLGKIMDALALEGKLDNTVIVFAGDHGYWYGEHGLNEERRLAYEEALRIPLLVRYPPLVKAGSTYEQMALNIDVAPTVLELTGNVLPDRVEGKSLVPLLKGETPADWRSSFLIEYNTDTVWPRTLNMGYRAIRTERYKYISYTDLEGMDELYDIEKDPYELKNQISNPAYGQVLIDMKGELEGFGY